MAKVLLKVVKELAQCGPNPSAQSLTQFLTGQALKAYCEDNILKLR